MLKIVLYYRGSLKESFLPAPRGTGGSRRRLLFFRLVLIIILCSAFSAPHVYALEPVQANNLIKDMMGKVGRGEAVFPLSKKGLVTQPPDSTVRAVPMSAIPQTTSVPSSRPASAREQVRTPRVPEPYRKGGNGELGKPIIRQDEAGRRLNSNIQALPAPLQEILKPPVVGPRKEPGIVREPQVRAKALFCMDCSSNKVVLAHNISEPLPIASITKLLTAMTAIDEMDLNRVLEVPRDIRLVHRHRVGLRPGDKLTTRDLLHGLLIESGNDCAEVLARSYPNGGWNGFVRAMGRKASRIGATRTVVYTPSGLDLDLALGRKNGRELTAKRPNTASAEDVAIIARKAFTYPLIREISSMKTYTMRSHGPKAKNYVLHTNDRLLDRSLPVAGAKTGFTNLAGRCIVAMFKDAQKAKDYMVVILNSPQHFKAAEKIYNWATKAF